MSHIGRPYTFSALGKDWTLSRFSFTIWEDLVAIAKTIIPNPREEASDMLKSIPEMSVEDKMEIVRFANKRAATMFELGSAEMLAWMATPTGIMHTIFVLLKHHHPDATLDTAMDIVNSKALNFEDAFAVVSGTIPPKGDSPGG